MSEFAYFYRGRDTTASPEQMQKTTEKWYAWFKELEAKGAIKNLGNPLENSGSVVKGKQKLITDGPFAEAKDVVAGYSLVEAADLAQAVELAKGCPIFEVDGSVEVRPIQKMKP